MTGLNIFSVLGILIFIAIITVVLWYFRNRSKSTNDYYTAGESLNGFVTAFTWSASACSAGVFIGGAGMAYTYGYDFLIYQLGSMTGVFISWLFIAPRIRKMSGELGSLSTPALLAKRYGSPIIRTICSLLAIGFMVPMVVIQFKGAAVMFQSYFGIGYVTALIIFGVIVSIFTAVGGFVSIAYLDTAQGLIMCIGMAIIIPVCLIKVGGVAALNTQLSQIDPKLLMWAQAMPRSTLIGMVIIFTVSYWGQPHLVQRFFSMKDSKAARIAFPISLGLFYFWILAAGIAGLTARVLWPNLTTGDLAMPTIIAKLMGPESIILWLAIVSAIFTTIDSVLITLGGNISHDLIKGLIFKRMSDKTELQVAKFGTFAITVIGFLIALNPPDLMTVLNSFAWGAFVLIYGLPLALAIFRRKANAASGITAVIVGPIAYVIWKLFLVTPTGIPEIVGALIITIPAIFIAEKFGKPLEQDKIDLFFPEK